MVACTANFGRVGVEIVRCSVLYGIDNYLLAGARGQQISNTL